MKANWKSIEEIVTFANKLIDSTISEQNSPYKLDELKEGPSKGGFGQYLENAFFGLETNSRPEPDFYPIPLELKATPLKVNSKGNLVPKERLVLNIIDYVETAKEASIYDSHFLMKNAAILIVWYLHGSSKNYRDIKIDLTGLWECLKEDKDQIISDWNCIVNKIKHSKAHEISEGDTLYLGACTKGANAISSYRKQFGTDVLAKQRAFCFKIQYMNIIYERMKERQRNKSGLARFCKPGETVQAKIISLLQPYVGRTLDFIAEEFKLGQSKSIGMSAILHIIGTNGKRPEKVFYEFAASNIMIKTIKVDENGKNKESMSFPHIKYCEIINEEWENSELYNQLTRKFLCPIFVYDNKLNKLVFNRCTIWNMPEKDLDIVKEVWLDAKEKISKGIYDDFVKLSDNKISHVRPHGRNKLDTTMGPQGYKVEKKCFWLNASYIFENIVNKKTEYSIGFDD